MGIKETKATYLLIKHANPGRIQAACRLGVFQVTAFYGGEIGKKNRPGRQGPAPAGHQYAVLKETSFV
jgi:hypothetical protein